MNDHERAKAVLEAEGHVKGSYYSYGAGGHCALGCYRRVDLEDHGLTEQDLRGRLDRDKLVKPFRFDDSRLMRRAAELCDALGLDYTDGWDSTRVVAAWNDRAETTLEDLAHGFELASKLHEDRKAAAGDAA